MHEISAGGGGGIRASDRANAGHPGSLFNRVSQPFLSASQAGVYRDIDNAFSAGGHDGSGSPQSAKSLVIPSNKPTTPPKRKRKPSSDLSGAPVYSPSVPAPAPSAKSSFKYYEAPIAKKFGFSKTTAYQEALANTAYRREMADMRKAGLNPSVIYGSHNSSGANSNIYPRDDFAVPSYGDYGGSGGSGGSGRSYLRSRGGNSGKYLFSGGAYYGIMAATAVIASIATDSIGAGMAAAGIAGTGMKALNGFFRK